jgi:hypothetical protein
MTQPLTRTGFPPYNGRGRRGFNWVLTVTPQGEVMFNPQATPAQRQAARDGIVSFHVDQLQRLGEGGHDDATHSDGEGSRQGIHTG